jgi:excisionase family DNA binding protein
MTIQERLRRMVAVMPEEGSVSLPVATLRQWLAADDRADEPAAACLETSLPDAGLTVAQVAAHTKRKTSTVRGWLLAGRFPEAFRLGREWRIPKADLARFLGPREAPQHEPTRDRELSGKGDLGAWRIGR